MAFLNDQENNFLIKKVINGSIYLTANIFFIDNTVKLVNNVNKYFL